MTKYTEGESIGRHRTKKATVFKLKTKFMGLREVDNN